MVLLKTNRIFNRLYELCLHNKLYSILQLFVDSWNLKYAPRNDFQKINSITERTSIARNVGNYLSSGYCIETKCQYFCINLFPIMMWTEIKMNNKFDSLCLNLDEAFCLYLCWPPYATCYANLYQLVSINIIINCCCCSYWMHFNFVFLFLLIG